MTHIRRSHINLYVRDQAASRQFYEQVLGLAPQLDVPGMTEFELGPTTVLGLMPETGIKNLLGQALPDPALAGGVPRAELYLVVDEAATAMQRALQCGAKLLAGFEPRDWGDRAGYVLDPDGHVLALAERAPNTTDTVSPRAPLASSNGQLHHVEIYCSDLADSLDFWEWLLLGLGYVRHQDWPEGRSFLKGETYLVFVQCEPDHKQHPYHRKGPGLNHLAFHLDSRSAVDRYAAQLTERGTKILYSSPLVSGTSYAVYFEDPERIKVELVAPASSSGESPPSF